MFANTNNEINNKFLLKRSNGDIRIWYCVHSDNTSIEESKAIKYLNSLRVDSCHMQIHCHFSVVMHVFDIPRKTVERRV